MLVTRTTEPGKIIGKTGTDDRVVSLYYQLRQTHRQFNEAHPLKSVCYLYALHLWLTSAPDTLHNPDDRAFVVFPRP